MLWRNLNDAYVEKVAGYIPQRLALFGQPINIDAPLTMLVTRDIQYVDWQQVKDWHDIRPLVLWWLAEDRPVFGFPPDGLPLTSPWPDLQFTVVDPQLRLVQVTRVE
jgi:hypothetical protein